MQFYLNFQIHIYISTDIESQYVSQIQIMYTTTLTCRQFNTSSFQCYDMTYRSLEALTRNSWCQSAMVYIK